MFNSIQLRPPSASIFSSSVIQKNTNKLKQSRLVHRKSFYFHWIHFWQNLNIVIWDQFYGLNNSIKTIWYKLIKRKKYQLLEFKSFEKRVVILLVAVQHETRIRPRDNNIIWKLYTILLCIKWIISDWESTGRMSVGRFAIQKRNHRSDILKSVMEEISELTMPG